MSKNHRLSPSSRPSLSFVLVVAFLAVLWLAGGASRADATGQIFVRAAAFAALIVVILFGKRPSFRAACPVWLLLVAALILALLQLIPLPPSIWQSLPGRALLIEAGQVSGTGQPWRPWSIVPGATINAAFSLIVPITMLALLANLKDTEQSWLLTVIVGILALSLMVGLLQFSGGGFSNPLVNGTVGDVGGTFANRNHFAVFLAFGSLIAPVWAFADKRRSQWFGLIALGLVLIFTLTILATGSRAGLILGSLAVVLGLVLVRHSLQRILRRYPRWVFAALIAGVVGIVGSVVLLSIAADRAISIDRILASELGQDMRGRGVPVVLAMIREYFPMGSGIGGFDPIFRMHEPFSLLKPTYFNHAHNDFLEVALDAGLPGVLLLLTALGWWAWASLRAWRAGPGREHMLPKLGSAMLLLVIIASAFDYPARTPMIMAMMVIAAVWLNSAVKPSAKSALLDTDPSL